MSLQNVTIFFLQKVEFSLNFFLIFFFGLTFYNFFFIPFLQCFPVFKNCCFLNCFSENPLGSIAYTIFSRYVACCFGVARCKLLPDVVRCLHTTEEDRHNANEDSEDYCTGYCWSPLSVSVSRLSLHRAT